jgi:uncharacterized protein (DUF433 family)
MTIETAHRSIVREEGLLGGEPIVRGTRTPVRAVVELWRLGVSPEEIPGHLPHLTLAQVFDALSYYAEPKRRSRRTRIRIRFQKIGPTRAPERMPDPPAPRYLDEDVSVLVRQFSKPADSTL